MEFIKLIIFKNQLGSQSEIKQYASVPSLSINKEHMREDLTDHVFSIETTIAQLHRLPSSSQMLLFECPISSPNCSAG